jgi:hypothetical protein
MALFREYWEFSLLIIAGIMAFLQFFDRTGVSGKLKRLADQYEELCKLNDVFEMHSKESADRLSLIESQQETMLNMMVRMQTFLDKPDNKSEVQDKRREALLAVLKGQLFGSFKKHRSVKAWTDDEFHMQTVFHELFVALGGNGEESVWWEQKRSWDIVDEEDLERLKNKVKS